MSEAPIRFGLARWCALLAHRCDGLDGACPCDCHERRPAVLRRVYDRGTGGE